MSITFKLGILYNTISVLQPNELFNDWSETHVDQGFSWRSTSVSFGTLSDIAECEVQVSIDNTITLDENAIRIIAVPFEVGTDGAEIASIADSQIIEIPKGKYELIFSAIPADLNLGIERYDFKFVERETEIARIIRADDELSPPEVLLMEAEPAD